METLTDRLTRYLLTRQRRAARHAVCERAVEAGILNAVPLTDISQHAVRWTVCDPDTLCLCRDPDRDRLRFARALAHGGMSDLDGTPRVNADDLNKDLRDYVLRLLQNLAAPLRVSEVVTALLVARALGQGGGDLGSLFDCLQRPDPVVAIRVPCARFERHFGLMLEEGLIVPRPTKQTDVFHEENLAGRYRDHSDHQRRVSILTIAGTALRTRGSDKQRNALARLQEQPPKPLVIADETGGDLPVRVVAMVDLMLEGPGIDESLIAEALHICLGIAPKYSLNTMEELGFDPAGLGIDDLAIVVRAGRTVEEIISALMRLTADDKPEEVGNPDGVYRVEDIGRMVAQDNARASTKPKRGAELIQPVKQGTDAAAKDKTGNKSLFVETISGYGEARSWAIDLKMDLPIWRSDDLSWDEMSTRLLLSGPPGTGKTVFSRALCNTLQVPLLATSVGKWLEPSHLGDVLKQMSADFDTAIRNAPCILFIDEIDNIGSRTAGRGRSYDDYWTSLVNRLLELLDGSMKTEGVIIVGATNHPEKIDPALLRSGRLERHVVIPPPDVDALVGILAHHIGGDLEGVIASAGKHSVHLPATGRIGDTTDTQSGSSLPEIHQGGPFHG